MSGEQLNHKAWAQSMIGFIRERGMEAEFKDWSGGWPCPVASADAASPPVETAAVGDIPSRLMGWAMKARARGIDRIELDVGMIDDIVAILATPAPFPEDGMRQEVRSFTEWFATNCLDDQYDEDQRSEFASYAFDAIQLYLLRNPTPASDGGEVARLRALWEKVSLQFDHIPGGMHADLEDEASELWAAFDALSPKQEGGA